MVAWQEEARPGTNRTLVTALVGTGVVLRAGQYLANRSLWLDEACLALNLMTRSLAELTQPLAYGQCAPLGFLMVERLAAQTLGQSEYALRLFPLLAGVASLLLFQRLARELLAPGAVPIAVGLFALSEPLVYYASELKQYSSDVALALLIQLAAIGAARRKLTAHALLPLALVGSLVIWFSHPSVFVLAGVGLSLLVDSWRQDRRDAIVRLAFIGALWMLSFGAHYLLMVQPYFATNYGFTEMHRAHFAPFPPASVSDLQWYITHFFGLFDANWYIYATLGGVNDPLGVILPGVTALVCLAGVTAAIVHKKWWSVVLVSPLPIALLASALRWYPFWSRLLLFAVPAVVMLGAEGTNYLQYKLGKGSVAVAGLVALLFLPFVMSATCGLVMPRTREEIAPAIHYLSEHRQAGDHIYVYYSAHPAFQYYAPRYGLDPADCRVGVSSRDDWDCYFAELDQLRGHDRVWVIFSHVCTWMGVDEKGLFLYHLDRLGERMLSFETQGAAVYLYNLQRADRS